MTLRIDSIPLTTEEQKAHGRFLMAALTGLLSADLDRDLSDIEIDCAKVYAYAEGMIREGRTRILESNPALVSDDYRLAEDDAIIERWMENKALYTPAQGAVIQRMRDDGRPTASLFTIAKRAGVTEQTVETLVRAGVLEVAPNA